MPVPAEFNFDTDRLAAFSKRRMAEALDKYPAIYVNHLQVARHLEQWAERLSEENDEDFTRALREVGAHLRQGDYLPDGAFLEQVRPKYQDED